MFSFVLCTSKNRNEIFLTKRNQVGIFFRSPLDCDANTSRDSSHTGEIGACPSDETVKSRGAELNQLWHVKESSMQKAASALHRFLICSPVTGNGDSGQIAEKLFVWLSTNK